MLAERHVKTMFDLDPGFCPRKHTARRHRQVAPHCFLALLLCIQLNLSVALPKHPTVLGSIFGIGPKNEQQQKAILQQRNSPPPPPPVFNQAQSTLGEAGQSSKILSDSNPQSGEDQLDSNNNLHRDKVPPPPPPPLEKQKHIDQNYQNESGRPPPPLPASTTTTSDGNYVENSDLWMNSNNGNDGVNNQDYYSNQYAMAPQPQVYDNNNLINDDWYMRMQYDLDAALFRENDLLQQLDNLTLTVNDLQQHESWQLQQLDQLNERVAQAEAEAAHEHNQMLEYQANCTMLDKQVAILNGQVEEWKRRCEIYEEKNEANEATIKEVRRELQDAMLETEELAAMIERHHIKEELEMTHKSSKRGRGLFGWIFKWSSPSFERDEYDETLEAARSTLLRALQIERTNVEDLESIVTSLQKNNSAIAHEIRERNEIIDELNDRITAFEEDKAVMKAALRQLRKELKDEAPKSAKLMRDLEAAEEQIAKLQSDMEQQLSLHKKEVSSLQHAIKKKENLIGALQTNMTVLSNYVEKLEERLTDFALAKRDIELRERKFNQTEKTLELAEDERKQLSMRIQQYAAEHDELKKLLQELSFDRSHLANEKKNLVKSLNATKSEITKLQQNTKRFEDEKSSLLKSRDSYSKRAKELEQKINDVNVVNSKLKQQYDQASNNITALHRQLEELKVEKDQLQNMLREYEAARKELEEDISKFQSALATSEKNWKDRENELISEMMKIKKDSREAILNKEREVTDRVNQANLENSKATENLKRMLQDRSKHSNISDSPIGNINNAANTIEVNQSSKGKNVHPSVQMQTDVMPNIDETDKFYDAKQNLEVGSSPSKNSQGTPLQSSKATQVSYKSEQKPVQAPSTNQSLLRNNEDDADASSSTPRTVSEDAIIAMKSTNDSLPVAHFAAPNNFTANTAAQSYKENTTSTSEIPKRNHETNTATPFARNMTQEFQAPNGGQPTSNNRTVPFRQLRKFLARTTGVHGLITTPSSKSYSPKRPVRYQNPKTAPKRGPSSGSKNKREMSTPKGQQRSVPKQSGSPAYNADTSVPKLPLTTSQNNSRSKDVAPKKIVKVVTKQQKVTKRTTFFRFPFGSGRVKGDKQKPQNQQPQLQQPQQKKP